jgi:hypothetical protein
MVKKKKRAVRDDDNGVTAFIKTMDMKNVQNSVLNYYVFISMAGA